MEIAKYSDRMKEKTKIIINYFLNVPENNLEIIARDLDCRYDTLLYDYLKNENLILAVMGEATLLQVKTKLSKIEKQKKLQKKQDIIDVYLQFLQIPSFDLEEIAKELHYLPAYFKQGYLENEERQKDLNKNIKKEVKEKFQKCKEYEKLLRKRKKIDKQLLILQTYANSRYSVTELKNRFGHGITIANMVKEYETLSGKKIDSDLKEKIETRLEQSKEIKPQRRIGGTKDFYIIEQECLVALVKEEILGCSKYQMSLLITAEAYLSTYGNMKKTINLLEKNYNTVYTSLIDPNLELLLKPEVYAQICSYLQIENILSGNGVSGKEKRHFIENVVMEFFNNNGIIETVVQKTGIPDSSLCMILRDPYVGIIVRDKELVEFISKEVDSYEKSALEEIQNRK